VSTGHAEGDLPRSWIRVRLGEICDALNGKAFKKSEWSRSGVPIIRIQNLKDPNTGFNYFTGPVESSFKVQHGDLLFAWSGTPGTSFGAHIWRGGTAVLNQHIFNLRFDRESINPRYLCFLLNQRVSSYVQQAQGGVGLAHITKSKFLAAELPIAPRREQLSIVSELERYISRIDASVEGLDRAKTRIARYRASVLRAACEGRLVPTEAELARAEGRDYEPATELLDRLVGSLSSERREGRPSATDASIRGIPELRKIPEGWAWTSLRRIADLKGGLTKGQKRDPTEVTKPVPYLRVANVQRGWLDLSEVKEIEATDDEIEELRLKRGDVLFNEGGDRDKLGRGWVWQEEITLCIHQNHVFRARIRGEVVRPGLLSWYGNSFGQDYFVSEGKQTTNLASINLTKLGNLPVPIPPTAEQDRIMAEVDRRLSIADEIATTIDAALARAERLRQSILKRAFEGKLVPQDPNDEPASVFLERIRKEREAAAETEQREAKPQRAGATRRRRARRS